MRHFGSQRGPRCNLQINIRDRYNHENKFFNGNVLTVYFDELSMENLCRAFKLHCDWLRRAYIDYKYHSHIYNVLKSDKKLLEKVVKHFQKRYPITTEKGINPDRTLQAIKFRRDNDKKAVEEYISLTGNYVGIIRQVMQNGVIETAQCRNNSFENPTHGFDFYLNEMAKYRRVCYTIYLNRDLEEGFTEEEWMQRGVRNTLAASIANYNYNDLINQIKADDESLFELTPGKNCFPQWDVFADPCVIKKSTTRNEFLHNEKKSRGLLTYATHNFIEPALFGRQVRYAYNKYVNEPIFEHVEDYEELVRIQLELFLYKSKDIRTVSERTQGFIDRGTVPCYKNPIPYCGLIGQLLDEWKEFGSEESLAYAKSLYEDKGNEFYYHGFVSNPLFRKNVYNMEQYLFDNFINNTFVDTKRVEDSPVKPWYWEIFRHIMPEREPDGEQQYMSTFLETGKDVNFYRQSLAERGMNTYDNLEVRPTGLIYMFPKTYLSFLHRAMQLKQHAVNVLNSSAVMFVNEDNVIEFDCLKLASQVIVDKSDKNDYTVKFNYQRMSFIDLDKYDFYSIYTKRSRSIVNIYYEDETRVPIKQNINLLRDQDALQLCYEYKNKQYAISGGYVFNPHIEPGLCNYGKFWNTEKDEVDEIELFENPRKYDVDEIKSCSPSQDWNRVDVHLIQYLSEPRIETDEEFMIDGTTRINKQCTIMYEVAKFRYMYARRMFINVITGNTIAKRFYELLSERDRNYCYEHGEMGEYWFETYDPYKFSHKVTAWDFSSKVANCFVTTDLYKPVEDLSVNYTLFDDDKTHELLKQMNNDGLIDDSTYGRLFEKVFNRVRLGIRSEHFDTIIKNTLNTIKFYKHYFYRQNLWSEYRIREIFHQRYLEYERQQRIAWEIQQLKKWDATEEERKEEEHARFLDWEKERAEKLRQIAAMQYHEDLIKHSREMFNMKPSDGTDPEHPVKIILNDGTRIPFIYEEQMAELKAKDDCWRIIEPDWMIERRKIELEKQARGEHSAFDEVYDPNEPEIILNVPSMDALFDDYIKSAKLRKERANKPITCFPWADDSAENDEREKLMGLDTEYYDLYQPIKMSHKRRNIVYNIRPEDAAFYDIEEDDDDETEEDETPKVPEHDDEYYYKILSEMFDKNKSSCVCDTSSEQEQPTDDIPCENCNSETHDELTEEEAIKIVIEASATAEPDRIVNKISDEELRRTILPYDLLPPDDEYSIYDEISPGMGEYCKRNAQYQERLKSSKQNVENIRQPSPEETSDADSIFNRKQSFLNCNEKQKLLPLYIKSGLAPSEYRTRSPVKRLSRKAFSPTYIRFSSLGPPGKRRTKTTNYRQAVCLFVPP